MRHTRFSIMSFPVRLKVGIKPPLMRLVVFDRRTAAAAVVYDTGVLVMFSRLPKDEAGCVVCRSTTKENRLRLRISINWLLFNVDTA